MRRCALISSFAAVAMKSSEGFVVCSGTHPSSNSHGKGRAGEATSTHLAARKAGKTSKRSGGSFGGRGGFGSGTTAEKKQVPTPTEQDDYAIFPQLDTNVQQTLVPAAALSMIAEDEAGELPAEIYHRLDQIYGFPNFNFQSTSTTSSSDEGALETETTTSRTTLMTDMLSTTARSSGEPSPLNNLLAAGTMDEKQAESPSTTPGSNLSLDSLPPFERFRVLHVDPLVLAIDDFFTEEECDRYVASAQDNSKSSGKNEMMQSRSPTVGKDAVAKAQRTSTTWYNHYRNVPELMAKASRLLGLTSIDHWEEPQTVRYRRNEKFTWHLDALGPAENQQRLGGQRTATMLVYHTTLGEDEGGATIFRDLGCGTGPLKVRPRKGTALLFFPSAGGIPDTPFDIRTLHCGEVVSSDASQDKWISQLWLRDFAYKPSAPPKNSHAAAAAAISDYCNAKKNEE